MKLYIALFLALAACGPAPETDVATLAAKSTDTSTLITRTFDVVDCSGNGPGAIANVDMSGLDPSSGMTIHATGDVDHSGLIDAGYPQVDFQLAPASGLSGVPFTGSQGALLGLGSTGGIVGPFDALGSMIRRAPDNMKKLVATCTVGTLNSGVVGFKLYNVVITIIPAPWNP